MGDYSRSRSSGYSDGRNSMQIEAFGNRGRPAPGPSHGYDLRSYSTSYAASSSSSSVYNNSNYGQQEPREMKLKKGKSTSGGFMGGCMDDPELQRKKRVAGYKVYSVEGKVKGSFRKSFRWLKDRYSQAVHGWW